MEKFKDFIDNYPGLVITLLILLGCFILSYIGTSAYYVDFTTYFTGLKTTLIIKPVFRVIVSLFSLIQVLLLLGSYYIPRGNSSYDRITDFESAAIFGTAILNLLFYIILAALFTI